MTLAEFLYMDGHGFYVWMSYGLGLITFIGLFLSTHLTTRRIKQQLTRQFRMQEQSKLNSIEDGE